MKKQFINKLTTGDSIDDIFVLSKKSLAQKRDGNHFLTVILCDKTGNIKAVMWDHVDQAVSDTTGGDFVHVKGIVSEYKGAHQIVIKQMTSCSVDSIDTADFIPATNRNIGNMFERLEKITGTIETVYLKELIEMFWNDRDFINKFKTAPAAKKMHHAYLGGLLEHTLSTAILVDEIARHYSGINRDLLLTGVILHDIGKINEFEYITRIDYTDEGRLLNHIVIGIIMIEEKIKKISEFPADQALLLKHLIASHHGSREFGSPEPPKTLEAVLLNYLDEIDSKINGIREFIAGQDPNEAWTAYHKPLGRFFYKGK